MLDLLIYQKILHAWFDAREPIENRNSDFPKIREIIQASVTGGRASNLIKVFYISLCSAPLLFACYACIYKDLSIILLILPSVLLVVFDFIIYMMSPGRHNK